MPSPLRASLVVLGFSLAAVTTIACDKSSDDALQPPAGVPTSGDAQTCEGYALGDSCVDDENLAQCREMAAKCPGEVMVMESCPLQFACP